MTTKTRNTISWILAGLLGLVFLMMGGAKLAGAEEVANNFARWGYPPFFLYIIGTLELLGAIGLLIPRFRGLAAAGLVGVMIGAVGTHIVYAEWGALVLPLVLGLIAGLLAYWHRSSLPFRGSSPS